uniref:Uncharacterized protein n=1 Tax=Timspurckia oligopyrenoides TaxID=708627 RepID=A0A7S0ZDY3_9RHOD|mmetsp:Transcript_14/g.28  ORF Transcript_14/g.28 Transcript_14/m.28 type:complete len:110 (+) Transcript_14:24-353(+)
MRKQSTLRNNVPFTPYPEATVPKKRHHLPQPEFELQHRVVVATHQQNQSSDSPLRLVLKLSLISEDLQGYMFLIVIHHPEGQAAVNTAAATAKLSSHHRLWSEIVPAPF